MPASNLFSSLDYRERDQLSMSGAYDREAQKFVGKGVICLVNSVFEALRASGQFEEEFQPFNDPDYDQMIENNGTIVVADGDRPFYFKSDDLYTAEMKDDGSCMIDLRGWATDLGINLDDWSFDVRSMSPVTREDRNASNCPDDDVLVGLVASENYTTRRHVGMWSAHDAIETVLVPILRHMGKADLADQLHSAPWELIGQEAHNGRYKYVDYTFDSDEQDFDNVGEAQRAACEEYELEEVHREFFQFFQVHEHFANLLRAEGMVVTDIGELTVWGRQSCGMAISMEGYAMKMFAKDEPDLVDSLIREILPDVAQRLDAEHDAVQALQAEKPRHSPTTPSLG